MSTVHHQEYLNAIYTAIGICHYCSTGQSPHWAVVSMEEGGGGGGGICHSRHQQNWNDKYLLRVYSVEILLMMDSGHV